MNGRCIQSEIMAVLFQLGIYSWRAKDIGVLGVIPGDAQLLVVWWGREDDEGRRRRFLRGVAKCGAVILNTDDPREVEVELSALREA